MVKVGVVIVSYGHETDMLKILPELLKQLQPGDKLVVVDNKKPYRLKEYLDKHQIIVDVITHDNGGFAAGCNFAVSTLQKNIDMLLFLNPDTFIEQVDYLDKMRNGYGHYDIWQSLLVMPNGKLHSNSNNVHITGLTWSNGFNTLLPEVRTHKAISNVCGGAMAIDIKWWDKIGGFEELYFMYFEDVDISTRILLAGGRLGLLEDAELGHQYSFEKGDYKWFYLERNRQIYMLINWPLKILLITFLPNIVFNFIIFLQYLINGRPLIKIKADLSFLRLIPTALHKRQQYRHLRCMPAKNFYHTLSYRMDSELLGKTTDNKIVSTVMKLYYRAVRLFLV